VSDGEEIRSAYDGSSIAFRTLEGCGWGELTNLGFYPWYALPGLVRGLAPFQRGLARRSLALLEPRAGMRVLDAACGRGYTTAQLARAGVRALGVDLLAGNIAIATARYGEKTGARYAVADATRLPAEAAGVALESGSFDAVHCLEAAFHFGPKGRRAFLEESRRLLRPGGRLVLVDFVWNDDRPDEIAALDPERLVRDTWRFSEFEPFARYRATARALGFREIAIHDWTTPVTRRFQAIGTANAKAGTHPLSRALVCAFRPGLAKIQPEEWRYLVGLMRAHGAVQRASRYVAFVLEKRNDA
jgi:MPBQ/MSBQ methyltransferase